MADPAETYAALCADCHGADRLGGAGPALIPETLKRMRGPNLENVIATGRVATQMPGFGGALDAGAITDLAAYLKTPLKEVPDWTPDQIAETRWLDPATRPPLRRFSMPIR